MRRLDLKNYTFSVPDQKGILQFKPYNFQKTLEDILPHHGLGLNGPELLSAMEVVENLKKSGNEILLTDNDYRLIIETCRKFRGFQKFDERFLKRIYNCPIIPDEVLKIPDNGNGEEKK
ncbi:hypothetical protein ES705_38237 [subsurface metagenome]